MKKNCSKDVPGKNGNTNSNPAPKNEDNPKLHYNINIPYELCSKDNILSWVKEHCSRAIFQGEKGNETGYKHWNITLTLKTKKRFSWLKKHFCNTGHLELVRNLDAAFEYACKEDTRIDGPYYWPEPLKKAPKDPMIDKTLKDWQTNILNIIKKEPDDRTIYWFWSKEGGVGKTSFCKHLVLKHNAIYVNGKKNDVLFAISKCDPKLVVVNIPRCMEDFSKPYSWLEEIKDGLIFNGKYESCSMVFDSPHIIVFANFAPDYSAMSMDRWKVFNIDEDNHLDL